MYCKANTNFGLDNKKKAFVVAFILFWYVICKKTVIKKKTDSGIIYDIPNV